MSEHVHCPMDASRAVPLRTRLSHLRLPTVLKVLLTAGLMSILSHPLCAQVVSFDNYTSRDGIISDIVTCVIQDSRGYLWAGTWEGVSTFDGQMFRNYTPAQGLPNSYINCLTELSDPPGAIAAGMNLDGYCVIDGDSVIHRRVAPSSASNRVLALHEDSHRNLWIGTAAGMYLRSSGMTEVFHAPFPIGSVWAIEESPQGHLFVLSDSGLIHVDLSSFATSRVEIPVRTGFELHILASSPRGGVWVASTDTSVTHVVPGQRPRRFPLKFRPEFFLYEDRNGALWSRTGAALLHYPHAATEVVDPVVWTTENVLDGSYAVCATEDREGGLWLGGGNGLVRIGDKSMVRFPLAKRPYDPQAALAADNQNRIWLLIDSSVIRYEQDGEWRWKSGTLRLTHPGQQMFFQRDQRLLWISTRRGEIAAYAADLIGSRLPAPAAQIPAGVFGRDVTITRILPDRGGAVWAGIAERGLAVWDPAHPTAPAELFPSNDATPLFSVRAITEDRAGNIWAGEFWQGLAVNDRAGGHPEKWRTYRRTNGLSDNSIRVLCTDSTGAVWVGTRYGGITRITNGTFRIFTVREGLPSNAVWSLAADEHGVWAATGSGVCYIDAGTGLVRTIDAFPKIPFKSIALSRPSTIAALSENDLYVYDLSRSHTGTTSPPVYITSYRVNGGDPRHVQPDPLTHDQNTFAFSYIGLSFDRPKGMRYQYMMDGIDTGWQDPTDQRMVIYTSLSPGTYQFRVRARNTAGIVSESPDLLDITILPPWWETWWFRPLAGLFVAGIVAAGAVLRVRMIDNRRKAQEEFSRRMIEFQEGERKRIGAELHDSLGQELLLLKTGIDRLIQEHPPGESKLKPLSERASASLKEVRDIAYDLHPHTLDRLGLRGAIESVVMRFTAACDIPVAYTLDEIDGVLSKEQEINFFRVVQEGLNNIARHSGATKVTLTITRSDRSIAMELHDNGMGFDVAAVRSRGGGFGMTGMTERIRLVGGKLTVASQLRTGTTVQATLPIGTRHGGAV